MNFIPVNDRAAVELFHLLFLAQLGTKMDKRRYALKGGCNLRFFCKSPRYSEDMDLDVVGIPVEYLKEKIDAMVTSTPFALMLATRGIRIAHFNNDKQTKTTQRWKFGLGVSGRSMTLPTKVEFSRRNVCTGSVFEPIDPAIIVQNHIQPVMISHYPRQEAYIQKVGALIGRTQPQARDVFDIHLLLASGAKADVLPAELSSRLGVAKEQVLQIGYAMFRDQVLAFLPPDQQSVYDADAWDAMRLFVMDQFERVRDATH